MKRFTWVMAAAALCLWASTAAADLELLDVDLQHTEFVGQGPGALNSRSDIAGDPGTRFNITLSGGGWQDIQIGDSFDLPSNNSGIAILAGVPRTDGMPDLSGFSSYDMTIRNPNSSGWFMANIYLNSGATDLGEVDQFSQNGWEWVAPGAQVTLSIDLSGLTNPEHISNIGLKIGSNMGSGDYYMPADTPFDVDVIPAPGAVVLGMIGMSMVGWAKRRFS